MNSLALAVTWAQATTAVTSVLALLAALLATLVAYRTEVPQRKLRYEEQIEPVDVPSGEAERATLVLGSEPINHPHIAALKAKNTGSRKIEKSHFHGETVEFDFNARIVAVIGRSTSKGRRVPPVEVRGSALHLLPGVIHTKQKVEYTLLLDGENPSLTPSSTLDGEIARGSIDSEPLRNLGAMLLMILAAISAVLLIPQLSTSDPEKKYEECVRKATYKYAIENGTESLRKHIDKSGGKVRGHEPSAVCIPPSHHKMDW